MGESLPAFTEWLASTPLSLHIQTTAWVIPAVQTLHILAIAAVVAAVFLIHLRVMGLALRSQATATVARRFMPWLWGALVVLALSGLLLIIGEPARSLENGMFQGKMLMLAVVVALTAVFARPLRYDPAYWEATPARRMNARGLAIGSLALWVGIVFAGRWIAYWGG